MAVFCSKAPSRGAYGGGEGDQRDGGGPVEMPVSRLSSYFKIWYPNGTISKIRDLFRNFLSLGTGTTQCHKFKDR
jgi:hypothetical protein